MNRAAMTTAWRKTNRMFLQAMPILAGMLLLVGLVVTFLPHSLSRELFSGMPLLDALEGAVFGSLATGQPVVSYILGKGLLEAGIGWVAVTALILSWVTVGIVQLPAESMMLGLRFAVWRNGISFVLAVIVALLVGFMFGAGGWL